MKILLIVLAVIVAFMVVGWLIHLLWDLFIVGLIVAVGAFLLTRALSTRSS